MNSGNFISRFLSDYGMIAVLIGLGLLFSVLTLDEQHPTGEAAGCNVAQTILAKGKQSPSVLIVTRPTEEDVLFAKAAEKALVDGGAVVVANVNGAASDARKAVEQAIDKGKSIDWIAANDVTSKWSVYNRFESLGSDKCVTPVPYTWPVFLKSTNLIGVANQTAIYAIIAIGMTMVIITAGIDLSVGSLVAMASVCTAIIIRDVGSGTESRLVIVALAVFGGVFACSLAGAFSGAMITLFRVPPFIVTLAMMMMASGLAFNVSEGLSIDKLPESFTWLGSGVIAGIPNPIVVMMVLYVIAHLVMSRTVFGRYVYAIGGNEEAARLSGVPVRRMLWLVYTICGALAGLGGVLLTSQLAAGDPKFGQMYELDVIAAVVVGGTALSGGKGKIFGTLIGALIIAVIKNGMNLTNVEPFNQKIVLGAVLLLAVLLDTPMGRDAITVRAHIMRLLLRR